ncbi:hypothetical protein B296_00013205, partial [Ensete ventricosum]
QIVGLSSCIHAMLTCHQIGDLPMVFVLVLYPKVQGWGLISEGGILKLHRSWKVKSFTKGLEFFQLVANIAEAEGGVRTFCCALLIYRSKHYMYRILPLLMHMCICIDICNAFMCS